MQGYATFYGSIKDVVRRPNEDKDPDPNRVVMLDGIALPQSIRYGTNSGC